MSPEEENRIEELQSKKIISLSDEDIALWLKKYNEIWEIIIRNKNEKEKIHSFRRKSDG